MREIRPSGSVEGVMGNHDPYSDWGDRSPSRDFSSSVRSDEFLRVPDVERCDAELRPPRPSGCKREPQTPSKRPWCAHLHKLFSTWGLR